MSYDFSEKEEHKLLRETVRSFAESKIAPLAKELDEAEEFSYELTEEMGHLGLFGTYIPEKLGGQELDYLSYIIAVEELARVDGSQAATIAAHNSLGLGPLYYYGTQKQKDTYIPDLCTGKGLWAFGLTESEAGSDAQSGKTNAKFDSASKTWILNGSKLWITNSASKITKGVTVLAKTGSRNDGKAELTCFIVPQNSKGLSCKIMKEKMMWRASNTGELYFDNVAIPEENILGTKGQGFKIMMETLDNGRLSIAAMGLGLAKGAYEQALSYSQERHSFGKAICKHQAIAFKLADMATRIEAAENLLYKACWLKDTQQPFQKLSAMAKLYCSELAEFCARESQQIFGGYGLMKEYPIERHYRDAALLRIGEGTSEIQRVVISRYIGC